MNAETSSPKLLCHAAPCSSCPYRRDTPLGVWDRSEYDKLPAWDDPHAFAGIFLCHQSNRKAVCRGWLEVHSNNLGVRLAIITQIHMSKHPEPTTVKLYASGEQARAFGLRGVAQPSRLARQKIAKLMLMKAKQNRA